MAGRVWRPCLLFLFVVESGAIGRGIESVRLKSCRHKQSWPTPTDSRPRLLKVVIQKGAVGYCVFRWVNPAAPLKLRSIAQDFGEVDIFG
jgi:hypothetical protein